MNQMKNKGGFKMNDKKISDFYKKLEQNGSVNSTLKEKIQHIKNECDLRKIIEDEIIPLGRKMGMNFTLDELMDYEKQVNQMLSDMELEDISGGTLNKNLFLGGIASLMFLGFGNTMTGSKVHAVNLGQAIHFAKEQLTMGFNPEEKSAAKSTKKSRLNKISMEAVDRIDAATKIEEQQASDQSQVTVLAKNTEVSAVKGSEIAQQKPTSEEGVEISEAADLLNPDEKTGETRGPLNEQLGLSKEQILAATSGITQTTSETKTAKPLNKMDLETSQIESNDGKFYCLEALNLCDPFIYNVTRVTNNLRIYNGFTESIVFNPDPQNPDNFGTRKYTADEGRGSVYLMNFLFPSPSGELNTTSGSGSVECLEKLNPTPEKIAQILSALYNYRIYRENGKSADDMSLEIERNRGGMAQKLGFDKKNPNGGKSRGDYERKTYMKIITEARYMIENQEKNGFSLEGEENRIFPKYTTEKLILSYFVKKFDKDEDIKRFYAEITKQLNNKWTPIPNKKVTKEMFDGAKIKLETTIQILNKCYQYEYSPYQEDTPDNGLSYGIATPTDGKVSFLPNFADCADTAMRHVMNLLIYSQGKIDHPDDPWANVLPADDSKKKELSKKLEEVLDVIKNKKETQVNFYTLKERLQMFFLYQKKVGVDAVDIVTRTLWEYAICNLTEPEGGIGSVKYCKRGYELDTGYKNMCTLMCRCANALFSDTDKEKEKAIRAAYEVVENCTEYDEKAVTSVFGLFNQAHAKFEIDKSLLTVSYPDLGGLNFIIDQASSHGTVHHCPMKVESMNSAEKAIVQNSENDFIIMFVDYFFDEEFAIKEDFHKLFFGKYIGENKITDSDFKSVYSTLNLLRKDLNEERDFMYWIRNTFRCGLDRKLIIKLPRSKTNFEELVFDKYIKSSSDFSYCFNEKKAFEIISSDTVTITSFSDDLSWTSDNTNTQFKYTIDQKGNAILYPMEDKENLYIPDTIFVKGEKIKVGGLGKFACYKSKTLRNVVLSKEIIDFQIGACAFYNCSNFDSVAILSCGLLKDLCIGDYAFSESGIKSFDFSALGSCFCENLKSIDFGVCSFSKTEIAWLGIPKNIESLSFGSGAFEDCFNFWGCDLSSYEKLRDLRIDRTAFQGIEDPIIVPKHIKNYWC